jgi:hypothetical protein
MEFVEFHKYNELLTKLFFFLLKMSGLLVDTAGFVPPHRVIYLADLTRTLFCTCTISKR